MIHDTEHRCLCGGALEILENEQVSIYCSRCDGETVFPGKTVEEVRAGMVSAGVAKKRLEEEISKQRSLMELRRESLWFRTREGTLV